MTLSENLMKDTTAAVVEAMRSSGGKLPWRKEWTGSWLPRNGHNGRPYMGINVVLLQSIAFVRGYESNDWFTYQGAKRSLGQVRRGEKAAARVVYWHMGNKDYTDEKTGKLVKKSYRPMWIKYYPVWNKDQIDWECPPGYEIVADPVKETAPWYEPCNEAVQRMRSTGVRVGNGEPAYYVTFDKVTMPLEKDFIRTNAYWATMFHELGHATGHKKRLDRDLTSYKSNSGSTYAFEELVAELCSAFICQYHRIYDEGYSIDNAARYLNHWITAMNGDPKYLFKASKQAQEAARYILNFPDELNHTKREKLHDRQRTDG